MSAVIIDGKALGRSIEDDLSERVTALRERGVTPNLAVVIVGEDPASQVYVRNKQRACERCGILSTRIDLPSTATQDDILEIVADLNADDSVHGILVQSPAPEGVDELAVAGAIDRAKDVDGFHPSNLGKLVQGVSDGLLPCTPAGVLRMLEESGVALSGSKAVVIGRSRIVGMPMALMLAQRGIDCTVTIAHSRTHDVAALCREADIVVAAIGRPHTVKPDWIKPGAAVVDVGISRADGGGLAGDVDPGVAEVAGWMTPVPGGVGPMTIAMLLSNTVRAAESS
ncbi:MAG TPA: bifunctional 5,10-methylenetetrahydrofolate dehydrogenase/5,10-methenyltetrahydrofolate cyclohydrolase [Candidatus Poseidoniales archaeon]|nr:MAG: bifunctional 5,10-methylene-tetrahydrofolate dehydrogenase/5,10-methylene-tetrahydrofolate cyclohydrolase [Euryarchaeota archaeon]HIM64629.1 bifunctional 5,10-methylenetetrahydrofolate dehydrogenase/5,10-methenyltetrahydrofolate cyclohydrolase [Candidatus Poseidoniales archaeon]